MLSRMAVTYFEELFEGRGGKDTVDKKYEHTRVFEVRTDDPNDDEMTAGAAAGLPRNGDPHPYNPAATMRAISCFNLPDDPTIWIVTCEYNTDLAVDHAREIAGPAEDGTSTLNDGIAGDRPENPLDRPAVYRVESEQTTEIVSEDWNLNPILNSAGDPYDPPPQIETSYPVIHVEKNFPVGAPILDLGVQAIYYDCVNTNRWHGIAAGQLRIVKIGCSYNFENGVAYGRVTFQMKLRWKGWKLRLADIGFNYLTEGGTKKRRIDVELGSGVYPDTPQPLNGGGQPLATGDPLLFNEYQVYRELDYGILGI